MLPLKSLEYHIFISSIKQHAIYVVFDCVYRNKQDLIKIELL